MLNDLKKSMRIIKIAIFDDRFLTNFATRNFECILDGYEWEVDGKRYLFRTKRIYDSDILMDKLNKFDAMVVGATDDYLKIALWRKVCPERYQRWKTNLTNFIKNGGGYAGHCGGANLICKLANKPETFCEKAIEESNLEIIETRVYQKMDIPLIGQLIDHPPDALEGAAYPIYDGFGPNSLGMGGVPIDFVIEDKSHPIFRGYRCSTVKIFWGGGPGLIAGNDAKVILKYPNDVDKIQPLDVWEYVGTGRGEVGKWVGLVRSIIGEFVGREDKRLILKLFRKFYHKRTLDDFLIELYMETESKGKLEIIEKIMRGLYKAKDWVNLHRAFKIKRGGMAAMVEETHGDGRVIISAPHTEDRVWDGGVIRSVDDVQGNCLWNGLMKWDNYGIRYFNDWILRREVAWISGLDENELPPIPERYLEKSSLVKKLIRFLKELSQRCGCRDSNPRQSRGRALCYQATPHPLYS